MDNDVSTLNDNYSLYCKKLLTVDESNYVVYCLLSIREITAFAADFSSA